MDCNAATASVQIREIQNCECSAEEGTIINLSPGFPIRTEDLHRDLVFPSFDHIKAFAKVQSELDINAPGFSSFDEARAWALKQKGINETWDIVKKGWSLTSKGKLSLAAQALSQYRKDPFNDPYELQYVLFDFCSRMLMPLKHHLFENAAEHCQKIAGTSFVEFQEFRSFYKSNMADDNLERYFDIFKEYFNCFSDFSQTLMHIQYRIEIPEDFVASSYAFPKTKLFYGNAFEALTSNVVVLACLNNIGCGRKFDQFESMDLKKYLTINKANRSNPFKDTPQFQDICSCINSTIRNASHHGGMKLINSGKVIQYRSGGDGMLRTMSYLSYLNQCNEIMLSCAALLALELTIAF